MHTHLVYVPWQLGHIRIKVDIAEDGDFSQLKGIEIMPSIIRLLLHFYTLSDNCRVTVHPRDILNQYLNDHLSEGQIEELLEKE